jgi:hypothetical protein
MGKPMKTNGLASAEAAAQAVAALAVARREPDSDRYEELERRIEGMEAALLASQRRLLESQEHLARRINELGAILAALHRETAALGTRGSRSGAAAGGPEPRVRGDTSGLGTGTPWADRANGPVDYDALVQRVRSLIEATIPPGSQVSVVSRGDSMLLKLDGRIGRHFPADDDGTWAGYHPKDSEAAIEHLERLKALGVGYFVLPHASYWWLEHYEAFGRYLEARYRLVAHREDTARVYALDEAGTGTRGLA